MSPVRHEHSIRESEFNTSMTLRSYRKPVLSPHVPPGEAEELCAV
jgi:hypothetical protein